MRNRALPLVFAVLTVVLSSTTGLAYARTLTIEDRIQAQRAIEQVYWRHRTWPEANRTPKPSLSAVLTEAALRSRVEDYLRKSNALAAVWDRPITSKQLQVEMERMARETKAPDVLTELFAALDNDPVLIAETLVRQKLVERRIRDAYAYDERFHGSVKRSAERALSAATTVADLKALSGEYRETTWRLADEAESHGDDVRRTVRLDQEQWDRHLRELARKVDPPRRLEETADEFVMTEVLCADAGEVTTATVSWGKTPLDAWWSRVREKYGTSLAGGLGIHEAVRPSGSGCADDTWRKTFDYIPPVGGSPVWTGTEMIVWEGTSGGRYDPVTDMWTAMSTDGGPPSSGHTAVWTGTEMIIWGGSHGTSRVNTGGRYDPLTDTWVATATGATVPWGRIGHTAVWTGTEMIVWGGLDSKSYTNTGGRYDPSTDTWIDMSTEAPSPRRYHTAVWTGTEMIVWGGFDGDTSFNTGGRYNPSTDQWAATSTPSLEGRRYHTAVWTGTRMIVWGGTGDIQPYLNTGGRYDPSTDTWLATSAGGNVPTGRYSHTAQWTGTAMIVWGGGDGSGALNSGSRYDPSTNTWATTSRGSGVPTARYWPSAVWTGTRMIVWSNTGDIQPYLNTGGRYDPSTNTWTPMNAGEGVPSARFRHTAVWTGAEMIVWGGYGIVNTVNTGALYDPATDTWVPTSTGPSSRFSHTAVWTGTEMIVWGGRMSFGETSTGGRYDPSTNSWDATSTSTDVPQSRYLHTAVWTGTEMIVWGGWSSGGGIPLNTGGRYNPSTNTWDATSTFPDAPQGRYLHTAVWTGTRMIVFGGLVGPSTALDTGGRYVPSTNTWEPMSTGVGVGVRSYHTAVWTGTEMIIWGGNGSTNAGGRYDPSSQNWTLTSTGTGVPTLRGGHSAVWTGTEMIVWAGQEVGGSSVNTGSRYHPPSDTWVAMSTGVDVPSARGNHTAVWTGSEMIVWGGSSPPTSSGGVYCSAARCAGSPAVCQDGNACTSDACDAGSGLCVSSPAPDGTACSDGINCTTGETCTSGACGGGTLNSPGELQNVRFTDETTLVWDAISDSPDYDALRGELSALPVGPGGGEELCFDALPGATLVDGTPVPPGTGFWYVIRGANVCGVGGYGTQKDSTPRTSTTCP